MQLDIDIDRVAMVIAVIVYGYIPPRFTLYLADKGLSVVLENLL